MDNYKWHYKGRNVIRNLYHTVVHGTLRRPPIVICGCGRSGTTLMTSIFSAHPNIFTISEETKLLCPTAYNEDPDLRSDLQIAKLYWHIYTQYVPREARRWCEKTPKNVLFIGKILDHFGKNVRIIHMVRDGRDVVTSIHPRAPDTYWVNPERWIADVGAALVFADHDQVLTVRYEDLVTDYSDALSRIGTFVEESMTLVHDNWVEKAEERYVVKWHNFEPVHDKSIGRWKRPEFTDRIARMMEMPDAKKLLSVFGYLD